MSKNDAFGILYRIPFVLTMYALCALVYILMVMTYWDIPRANDWWRTTT